MRRMFMVLGLVAASAAPNLAHASCQDRKVAGTVIGAVAGGLLGNAVSHGGGRGGGTIIGAVGGGVVGHEIARSSCRRNVAYRRSYRGRYERPDPSGYAARDDPAARCEMRDQAFYDEQGELVHRPTQVCR
jgi:uncharacterized protein YcfJ